MGVAILNFNSISYYKMAALEVKLKGDTIVIESAKASEWNHFKCYQ